GYSYVWSRNPDEPVPLEVTEDPEIRLVSNEAGEDGEWYFRIRAVDRIGNWSEPGTTEYYRDTTPPGRVRFLFPALDEDGYLASNTFALQWDPPLDDVIGGYSYDMVYVAAEDADVEIGNLPIPVPPARLLATEAAVRRNNFDNGLWALSVTAIDSVGNIGEPAVLYVRMNKYIPVTEIWAVVAIQDPLGRYNLEIVGRGFLANGEIIQVILDRDQEPPYDYVYDRNSQGFRIFGDRNLAGPTLDDIETGAYSLGLVHAERGLNFARNRLVLERNGTIKFGDFTIVPGSSFGIRLPQYGFLQSVGALAWVVIALLSAVVVFSASRIVAVTRDGRFFRLEARALIAGRPLPSSGRPERIAEMRKRGIGLRTKFAFFVVVLIMAVVAMMAIGLGTATLNNQRQILLQGLNDRVDVLMESLVSGAAGLLPEPEINTIPLTDLPRRTGAMDEALYATITGEASAATDELPLPGYNYVWATNDPIIRKVGETDSGRQQEIEALGLTEAVERRPVLGPGDADFVAGSTRVDDPLSDLINRRAEEINAAARAALGDLPLAIDEKFNAILKLASATFATPEEEAEAKRRRVQETNGLTALNDQIDAILDEIVGPVQSYPVFDPETFSEEQRAFIFYQPIIYPEEVSGSEDLLTARYFRGAVRIAVSTDLIVEQIADARLSIIRITGLIALAAIAAGIAGALLLATIVVIPINRLVRGVEAIRDTADKRELRDHRITLRSRDELSRLADTVNEMTAGLVLAAEADEALKISSDMQKMFMPLESSGAAGEKPRPLTSAHAELGMMEFHGYYEGADALSGDYFSFEKLDEKQYALIKCDVAGHGVEAAIIMVEVATIFLNYLRDWRAKLKSPRLTDLLVAVNDLVAERGFRGKFAAMTVGILNVQNGRLRVSHAGDRILQIYRASSRSVEKKTLNEIPATGVFSVKDFLPGMKYEEVNTDLEPGDILVLATDGIDESMRVLRDSSYAEIQVSEEQFLELCVAQGWTDEAGAKERGIAWDKDSRGVREELTLDRMHEIIVQVQTRGKYVLERAMNSDPDEKLEFDFKRVEPTAENLVLGLMSVEKIFRLQLDPAATDREMVRVDRKIADFLKEHFSLYARYFRYEVPEEQRPDKERDEYVWFSHLKEEEQLDDLTILAIRKK
ncbi:MAG: SpoIIE family protein phosphatase, partial [Spirochaetia bacterium]